MKTVLVTNHCIDAESEGRDLDYRGDELIIKYLDDVECNEAMFLDLE